MNIVDGACSVCGAATPYTGELPILCSDCKEVRRLIQKGSQLTGLITSNDVNTRILLPDSELLPKPVINK